MSHTMSSTARPRRLHRRARVLACTAALAAWLPAMLQAQPAAVQAAPPPTSAETWSRIWDTERQARPVAPLWTHAYLAEELQRVVQASGGLFALEAIGLSLEGRRLYHVTAGRGPFPVLLWSQMHGDEPSATPALFDLLDYLARHRTEPGVRTLLDRLTLHIVPMLNPDGAQRFERRNSQGIDINRDALRLQTPEGLALKSLRDRRVGAARVQPAQPGLADIGRHAAEARVDLPAVGRVRRGSHRETTGAA